MGIIVSVCIWQAILNKVARDELTVNVTRSFIGLFLVISFKTDDGFTPTGPWKQQLYGRTMVQVSRLLPVCPSRFSISPAGPTVRLTWRVH